MLRVGANHDGLDRDKESSSHLYEKIENKSDHDYHVHQKWCFSE